MHMLNVSQNASNSASTQQDLQSNFVSGKGVIEDMIQLNANMKQTYPILLEKCSLMIDYLKSAVDRSSQDIKEMREAFERTQQQSKHAQAEITSSMESILNV